VAYSKVNKYFPLVFTSASGGSLVVTTSAVIDCSAAAGTTSYAWKTIVPFILYGWGVIVSEVVGSFTTVKPVASISGTIGTASLAELGTLSPAGAEAVNSEIMGTLATLNQKFGRNDLVTFKTKTQGTGGTTTGDLVPFLLVEFFPTLP